MSKSNGKSPFALIVAIIASAFALAGCGIVSFEQISVTTFPSERNQIVGEDDPLWIEFSTSVEKEKAREFLRVSRWNENQPGDLEWHGNRLVFTPVPHLLHGVRHVFSFSGMVRAESGTEAAINIAVPFYVGSMESLPVLVDFSPVEGASAGVRTELVLTFSKPMDRKSFDEGFELSPSTEYDVTWDVTGSIVTMIPRDKWNNLTVYRWNMNETVRDATGIPVGYPAGSNFVVQEDVTPPGLDPAVPVQPGTRIENAGETIFVPSGLPMDAITYKDVILITFDEDVALPSLVSSFGIEPGVDGSIERIEERRFAFIPEDGFDAETQYRLSIGTGVEDLAGNHMTRDAEMWFSTNAGIPALHVVTVRNDPADVDYTTFNTSAPCPLAIDETDCTHTFTVVFDIPIEDARKVSAMQKVSVRAFFPPGLSSNLELESAGWPSDSELVLVWKGFVKSTDALNTNYYLLTITGGKDGVRTETGSYLQQDVWVLMEAEI
jgi:hypothetical protein